MWGRPTSITLCKNINNPSLFDSFNQNIIKFSLKTADYTALLLLPLANILLNFFVVYFSISHSHDIIVIFFAFD